MFEIRHTTYIFFAESMPTEAVHPETSSSYRGSTEHESVPIPLSEVSFADHSK